MSFTRVLRPGEEAQKNRGRLVSLKRLYIVLEVLDSEHILGLVGAPVGHGCKDRAPDRHIFRAVRRQFGTELDDSEYMSFRVFAVIVLGQFGQVSGLYNERGSDRALTLSVDAMTWRAIAYEHLPAIVCRRLSGV
jgi:hypothetical protein